MDDTPVVILAGGMGTRLQSVLPSKPKSLASVGGRPFLELLLLQLRQQGLRRILICTGHMAAQIEKEFGDGGGLEISITYSREPHPLGTAGAIKLAQHYLQHMANFLVMNGDSIQEMDFRHLLDFHRNHSGLVSMVVRQVPNADRYGTVHLDPGGRVRRILEKTGKASPGLVNSGVYVFRQAILDMIADGASSLEMDVFPRLLDQGVYAVEQRGEFIDIGTPEDYARAQAICDRLRSAALSCRDPQDRL